MLARRANAPRFLRDWLDAWRSFSNERSLEFAVRPSSLAVIAEYSSALKPFVRARRFGVPTFLNYGIPHYAVAHKLMDEEARLQPDYADSLRECTAYHPDCKRELINA